MIPKVLSNCRGIPWRTRNCRSSSFQVFNRAFGSFRYIQYIGLHVQAWSHVISIEFHSTQPFVSKQIITRLPIDYWWCKMMQVWYCCKIYSVSPIEDRDNESFQPWMYHYSRFIWPICLTLPSAHLANAIPELPELVPRSFWMSVVAHIRCHPPGPHAFCMGFPLKDLSVQSQSSEKVQ